MSRDKIKVVDESPHFWQVECEADGCKVKIAVPKRIRTSDGHTHLVKGPSARRCASHPPGSVAK